MKFWLRWTANCITIYLALYLVDSVAGGRFQVQAVWAAVIVALLLSSVNSLIRPLHWLKSKPSVALTGTGATLLVNLLVLQIFIWIPGALASRGFGWVAVVTAFLSLLTGTINWLIGFKSKDKRRTTTRRQPEEGPKRGAAPDRPATRS